MNDDDSRTTSESLSLVAANRSEMLTPRRAMTKESAPECYPASSTTQMNRALSPRNATRRTNDSPISYQIFLTSHRSNLLMRLPPRYSRRAGFDRAAPSAPKLSVCWNLSRASGAPFPLDFLFPPYLRSASPSAIASLPSQPFCGLLIGGAGTSRSERVRAVQASTLIQIQVERPSRLRPERPPDQQRSGSDRSATDSFSNDRRPTNLSFIHQMVFSLFEVFSLGSRRAPASQNSALDQLRERPSRHRRQQPLPTAAAAYTADFTPASASRRKSRV
jgi:hypothetical protein